MERQVLGVRIGRAVAARRGFGFWVGLIVAVFALGAVVVLVRFLHLGLEHPRLGQRLEQDLGLLGLGAARAEDLEEHRARLVEEEQANAMLDPPVLREHVAELIVERALQPPEPDEAPLDLVERRDVLPAREELRVRRELLRAERLDLLAARVRAERVHDEARVAERAERAARAVADDGRVGDRVGEVANRDERITADKL